MSKSQPPVNSASFMPTVSPELEMEYLTTLNYRSGDLAAYLTEISRSVSRLIQSDWTIVTLCQGETGQIIASNLEMRRESASFSVHRTLAAEVVQSVRSLVIENRQDMRDHNLASEYHAYLGVPLKMRNQAAIGTICSFLCHPRSFTEAEVKMVELFAERAATAIENFWLYQHQLQVNHQLSQEAAACSIDLKRSQGQLIEQERLAAIGEFTTMIVHEVRNPLTTIELGLRYAQKVLQPDSDQQRLNLALKESERLKHLLNDILYYAKPQVLKLSRLNLSLFLDEFLLQVQDVPEAVDRRINYTNSLPEVAVMADLDKLKQVFLNLFRNAFEAIAPQEAVDCSIRPGINVNSICIEIHNGGAPIPLELLSQIGTPFCSTKPSGTGLGLAISKRIIAAHGGELIIESSVSGTKVSVYLPMNL